MKIGEVCFYTQPINFKNGYVIKSPARSGEEPIFVFLIQIKVFKPILLYFYYIKATYPERMIMDIILDHNVKELIEPYPGIAVACSKLDEGTEGYAEKIKEWLDEARMNALTVITMQVPVNPTESDGLS